MSWIKVKKVVENGMASSDISSVIKCLYQITKIEGSIGDYIGIIREENVAPIIYKAGLGKHAVELDDLEILLKNNTTLPTFGDIKYMVGSDRQKYKPCSLHEILRNSRNSSLCKSQSWNNSQSFAAIECPTTKTGSFTRSIKWFVFHHITTK